MSLKIVFILANSADLDEMPPYAFRMERVNWSLSSVLLGKQPNADIKKKYRINYTE